MEISNPTSLSILIPTWNSVCTDLVTALHHQASQLSGLVYEIVVIDDGSTDRSTVEANQRINTLSHCRFIMQEHNIGRAAIRNLLARTARYDHLLFIDSHMSVISDQYLSRYLTDASCALVYGGYTISSGIHPVGNLRFRYEQSCLPSQLASSRSTSPYANFHTSNFMVHREVIISHPIDERFKQYGYEDVLWGKTLKELSIPIKHIDNPLGFNHFESNGRFMEKTDEGLETLFTFRQELSGYSRILSLCDRLERYHLTFPFAWTDRLLGTLMRRHLTGRHPTLTIFKLYRLCRLCRLMRGT